MDQALHGAHFCLRQGKPFLRASMVAELPAKIFRQTTAAKRSFSITTTSALLTLFKLLINRLTLRNLLT